MEQEGGGGGFTVSYTREVYEGDTLTRDERYTWRYDAQDEYVKVGPPEREERPRTRTGEDEPGATAGTAPDPPVAPATTPPSGDGPAAPPP